MSWETFKQAATVEFEGHKVYLVEWDIAVTEVELRARYDAYVNAIRRTKGEVVDLEQPATVNRVGDADSKWGGEVANLSYCVSNEFGANKARAVSEMAQAASAWQAQTSVVGFIYRPDQDAVCQYGPTLTTFSVRPWTSGGAVSFFPPPSPPPDGLPPRTLFINFQDFDTNPYYVANSPNVRTVGVFRHELGHILGLRHEHVRTTGCAETSDWRALTPYDRPSVMHYPFPVCNGLLTSDFSITRLDAQGVQQLYGDFKTSMLWHAPNGQTSAYSMNDTFQSGSANLDVSLWVPDSTGWKIADYNDFNKDGKRDIVWHHQNGDVQMWFMNGFQRIDAQALDPTLNVPDSSGWVMLPSGDFNKDGNPDIWWRHSSGTMQVWFMDGMTRLGAQNFGSSLNFADSTGWRIITVNDFNQDGNPDILLNNATTGQTRIWYMNGMSRTSIGDLDSSLNIVASSGWRIISANDFNSDGRPDIVWWHPWGSMQAWFMNGHARLGAQDFATASFPSFASGLTPIVR